MIRTYILLLLALPGLARGQFTLRLHENARVMAMGGAFVAVADDPQAGLLNPAGLRQLKEIGQDFSFTYATGATPSQLGAALANPGSESGAAFGAGITAQGVIGDEKVKYYVPNTGTSWTVWGRSNLGLGLRFPYRSSGIDSIKSRWETVADGSILQGVGNMQFGAQVERMFGGAADMVPRRLRAGVSLGRPGEYVIAYEWRGTERGTRYNFHYESTHIGGEISANKYFAARAGYVWGQTYYVTTGLAFGLIHAGWRFETGWQIPTGMHGETRWSVGFGYRG